MYDLNTEDNNNFLLKHVWKQFDVKKKDGIINSDEINMVYSILESQQTVSKIVCQHKLEWSYEPDAVVQQVETFFNDQIALKPSDQQGNLESVKNEKLDTLRQQSKKLLFWSELTAATYEPTKKDKEYETKKTQINNKYNTVLIDATAAETENKQLELDALDKEYKKGEYAPKERTVPNADNMYCFHPVAFVEQMSRIFEEGKICIYEARVRAFMRMLRVKEGTEKEKGYTTQFSGKQFSNMTTHPREVIKANGYSSSAAGAYQIMTDTFDGLKKYRDKYKITSFNQESQDKLCLVILKHNYVTDRYNSFYNPVYYKDKNKTIRDIPKEDKEKEWRKRFKGKQGDIISFIINDDLKRATLLASLAWASLPDSPYGQQSINYTFEDVKKIYENYLKEELISSSSELHLKEGFLKQFGYDCCKNKSLTNKPSTREGYDIEAAVTYLNTNAASKSQGDCALYVRKSINAGGIKNIYGHAKEYYDTDKLLNYGFTKKSEDIDSIQLIKGDIVAFGSVKSHSYGHIAMYNGTQWVSDFKQNSFWVASQYKEEKKYAIYRWE